MKFMSSIFNAKYGFVYYLIAIFVFSFGQLIGRKNYKKHDEQRMQDYKERLEEKEKDIEKTIYTEKEKFKQSLTKELNDKNEKDLKRLKDYENEINKRNKKERRELDERIITVTEKENVFNKTMKERTKSIPWVAGLISEYNTAYDENIAHKLKNKSRPALKGSEEVKRINAEKRAVIKENKILKYTLKYYESLFPWLEELKDPEIADDMKLLNDLSESEIDNSDSIDNAKFFLTEEEYRNLTTSEKYQLALDRYIISKKSKSQIGKMYERYIGYLYEQKNYTVTYQGIIEGYEDLGRDLICKKDNVIHVVQCKCWSKKKEIHENAINQLYGTTVKYWIEQNKNTSAQISLYDNINMSDFLDNYESGEINAVIYTSTKLSDTAREFADALKIKIYENFELKDYPIIKCNINKTTGALCGRIVVVVP